MCILEHTVVNKVWYSFKLCVPWVPVAVPVGTPWFQKLPVCHECENSVCFKTLVRLNVLAPVFRTDSFDPVSKTSTKNREGEDQDCALVLYCGTP